MTDIESIADLREVVLSAIDKYDSIAILTHKNPDGDGLSTCLVLQEIINKYDRDADIVLEAIAPDSLDFLQAKEKSTLYREGLSYALILMIDCHTSNRLGICAALLDQAETIIAIDHHIENGELISDNSKQRSGDVDLLYNDPYIVSAGAIVYLAFKEEIDSLPPEIRKYCATAIYVSIINDTNNFVNKNTDSRMFEICADISRMDIKPYEITRTFMFTKPVSYYKFIGEALSTIKTAVDGKVLLFHSTMKMLADNNLGSDATSKVTNWLQKPKDVKVILYFREIGTEKYRVSLRSEHIDVNRIAVKYRGGGHKVAAGCEIKGNLADIESSLIDDIKQLM